MKTEMKAYHKEIGRLFVMVGYQTVDTYWKHNGSKTWFNIKRVVNPNNPSDKCLRIILFRLAVWIYCGA